MERIPRPGEFYRHLEGGLYQVAAVAEHTETGERLVIYQALFGNYGVYAAPLEAFMSETDAGRPLQGGQKRPFERVCPKEEGAEPENGPEEPETGGASCGGQEPAVSPLLTEFLDEEDFDRKMALLSALKKTVTQRELDILYEVLDLPPVSGDPELQAASIESGLRMRQRFSGTRLR